MCNKGDEFLKVTMQVVNSNEISPGKHRKIFFWLLSCVIFGEFELKNATLPK